LLVIVEDESRIVSCTQLNIVNERVSTKHYTIERKNKLT
jgi:hypothetical protein